jgi:hypothetical protein
LSFSIFIFLYLLSISMHLTLSLLPTALLWSPLLPLALLLCLPPLWFSPPFPLVWQWLWLVQRTPVPIPTFSCTSYSSLEVSSSYGQVQTCFHGIECGC